MTKKSWMYFTLAFVILGMAASLLYAQKKEPASRSAVVSSGGQTSGKFQLFQGTYGLAGQFEMTTVIRIDSQTGKTWMLVPEVPKAGQPAGWVELPEFVRKEQ